MSTSGLTNKIYNLLLLDILDGKFSAGQKLATEHIATEKQVSRTPVREALRLLAQDGIVDMVPNFGATVHKPCFDEIQEIYQIRQHLESIAVKHFVDNKPSAKCIEQLEELCRQRDTAYTLTQLEHSDLVFHQFILRNSGLKLIPRIIESKLILVSSFRISRGLIPFDSSKIDSNVRVSHHNILAAIINNDSDLAASLMNKHIKDALEFLQQSMSRTV